MRTRDCGRHACKRRCCDGNCPPCPEVLCFILPFLFLLKLFCVCAMLYNYGCFRFVIKGFGAKTTNALHLAIGMLHIHVSLLAFLMSIMLCNKSVRLENAK